MNKELIPHVFASLQNLERYLENIKRFSDSNVAQPTSLQRSIDDQERVLKQMRRVANKLQIEVAREQWDAVVRTLRIFYGLNHMVRPDVMATFVQLSKGQTRIEESDGVRDSAPQLH
mgnify:CR=1 FL=1